MRTETHKHTHTHIMHTYWNTHTHTLAHTSKSVIKESERECEWGVLASLGIRAMMKMKERKWTSGTCSLSLSLALFLTLSTYGFFPIHVNITLGQQQPSPLITSACRLDLIVMLLRRLKQTGRRKKEKAGIAARPEAVGYTWEEIGHHVMIALTALSLNWASRCPREVELSLKPNCFFSVILGTKYESGVANP